MLSTARAPTSCHFQISQRSSKQLLEAVKTFYGGDGNIADGKIIFRVSHSEIVIEKLLPYSIVKKAQYEISLQLRDYVMTGGRKRTPTNELIVQDLRTRLTDLKKV